MSEISSSVKVSAYARDCYNTVKRGEGDFERR